MVDAAAGGYDPVLGWSPQSSSKVEQILVAALSVRRPEADGDDGQVEAAWQTIAQHSDDVVDELVRLLDLLRALELDGPRVRDALLVAARWHDRGKAHRIFQEAIMSPPRTSELWAKAPAGRFASYKRRGFRHELASALAAREQGVSDLASYLMAAHHGKVRRGLRPMPEEAGPARDGTSRFARGVWEGDPWPAVDLGGGVIAPEVVLSLEALEMGLGADGRPSWTEATLRLRDQGPGPFRLAFLEALLRIADMRASAAVKHGSDLGQARKMAASDIRKGG
jgi:CRISPR-associated endonuclease/helicase Cas3